MIAGIELGLTKHKVAAYTNDFLFFITKLEVSIPNLLKELEMYSNYKINKAKSEIFNTNGPEKRGRTFLP